jgi:putative sigma-54 modulation protein
MNLIVRGKNIPITDSLRDYVEKRIFKMERFLGEIEEAQATLSVEKDRHRVEVTIPLNGFLLRGEEETGDMYSSVDLVMDKLEKQVEKYKTRLIKKIKSRNLPEIVVSPVIQSEEEQPQIIRTKRFAIKPMTAEEAVMQMNLIGHSFFVFSNAESEEVNVVYRRKDGHYGLIEPEF